MTKANSETARKLHWLALLLLFVVPAAIFSRTLAWDFISIDDARNIYENPDVSSLSLTNLKTMFTDVDRARRYLPLGWMSYAVDQHFFGLSAFTYHLGNLLLHSFNSVLVYLLFRRLLHFAVGSPALVAKPIAGVTGPALAALLWSLNPLRVEPVSWCSSRIYLVAAAFFFGSLLTYLRAAHEEFTGRSGARWRWLAASAFLASLLTYPIAVFGVFAFALLEIFPLRRVPFNTPWRAPVEVRHRLLPFAIIAAMLLGGVLWCNYAGAPIVERPGPPRNHGTLAHQITQAFFVWGYYIWKPWFPFNLSPEYTTLRSFDPFSLPFLASVLGVVALTVWLFRRRAQWPAVWIAWLAHLSLLVPLLGLTESRYHPADRYDYIVGILPVLLLSGAIWKYWKPSLVRPVFFGAAALLLASAVASVQQLNVWRNPVTLREQISKVAGQTPFRPYADEWLGATYRDAGSNALAVATCRAALQKNPNLPLALLTLGDVAQDERNFDEAIRIYDEVLSMKPNWLEARMNRAVTLGKHGKLPEAILVLRAIVETAPQHQNARRNFAFALELQGRTNDARLVMIGQLPPLRESAP